MGGHYRQSVTSEEYLSQRTSICENGCWLWTKGKDRDGYGQCQSALCARQLKVTRAHQLAWATINGLIPSGMFVCHRCDNPSCINPEHLFIGTALDNNQDMIRKGRSRPGKGNTKLSKEQRVEIFRLKGTATSFIIAKQFGISFSRVCQIWRGE